MRAPKNRGKGELAPPNHEDFTAAPAAKIREPLSSKKRAERGARGKLEGVYFEVNDRKLPQRNKVMRRLFGLRKDLQGFLPHTPAP